MTDILDLNQTEVVIVSFIFRYINSQEVGGGGGREGGQLTAIYSLILHVLPDILYILYDS